MRYPLWITIAIALLTLFCHLNDAAASPLTLNLLYTEAELSGRTSVYLENLSTETKKHQTDWKEASAKFEADIRNYNDFPKRTAAERLQKRELAFALLAPFFTKALSDLGLLPPVERVYDISGGRDVDTIRLNKDMQQIISKIRDEIQRQLSIKEKI